MREMLTAATISLAAMAAEPTPKLDKNAIEGTKNLSRESLGKGPSIRPGDPDGIRPEPTPKKTTKNPKKN